MVGFFITPDNLATVNNLIAQSTREAAVQQIGTVFPDQLAVELTLPLIQFDASTPSGGQEPTDSSTGFPPIYVVRPVAILNNARSLVSPSIMQGLSPARREDLIIVSAAIIMADLFTCAIEMPPDARRTMKQDIVLSGLTPYLATL